MERLCNVRTAKLDEDLLSGTSGIRPVCIPWVLLRGFRECTDLIKDESSERGRARVVMHKNAIRVYTFNIFVWLEL